MRDDENKDRIQLVMAILGAIIDDMVPEDEIKNNVNLAWRTLNAILACWVVDE